MAAIYPDRLLGLDAREVESLLGTAALIRREPPAQVWQYLGNDCVLHLFLYQKEDTYRVDYIETRQSRTGAAAENAACIAGLINDHKDLSAP
jgi:hypothetical protein